MISLDKLSQTIAILLGVERVSLSYFSSGDLSSLYRVETDDGRQLIAKGGPAPETEAQMLIRIAETGAPAPPVIAFNEDVLIMEEVRGRSGASAAQANLGRVLTMLHGAHGSSYGFDRDYAFGKVAIINRQTGSWVTFWRDNRLLNSLPYIPSDLSRRLERLSARLDRIIPDTPPPSLLHGDLWSGNVMSDGKQISALIDPASYYGDREVDLAMLNLFGHLTPAFYAHYPALEPGHEERLAIYSLWPALVHLRLFGEGYRSMVDSFLSRLGF